MERGNIDKKSEEEYIAQMERGALLNPRVDSTFKALFTQPTEDSRLALKANAGENCQITVDAVGGIHIASYDTDNANLVYAYLSNYDDTTPSICTVDGYAFTGINLMIDAALTKDSDGNYKYVTPYISYYMSSSQKPKIAYLPNVISASSTASEREAVTIPDGADSEFFTEKWESSIVPTASKYADNYSYSYINVAVWKNANGQKIAPTAAQSSAKTSSVDGDKAYCYGNGTEYPVMGYGIRVGTKGYIETAQMK